MSSHREAPEISKDPVADSTDLYAFSSPDKPDTVTIIANYIPLQAPAGGPNFFEFGDDVMYNIFIDNDGDGMPEIQYQLRFHTLVRNSDTFLYNTGPISSNRDKNWNRLQTFSMYRKDGNGKFKRLGQKLACPPCNIGPRSTPHYSKLSTAAVHNLPTGETVFAGQRREGFYVDLGSVFDLAALRPFQSLHLISSPGNTTGINTLANSNVHSIAIQIPKTRLTSDGTMPTNANSSKSVIGVWTSATRRKTTIRSDDKILHAGPFVQVSRLGMPLINEVIIPMVEKDRWNKTAPQDDAQFVKYYAHPVLQAYLSALYPGVFKHLAAYTKERVDLEAILLTGIPSAVGLGFQNYTGPTPADQLRLNMAIPPTTKNPNIYGLLAGDAAGFPNGRRVFDDIVTVELWAVAGATIPVVDKSYKPDGAATAIFDVGPPGSPPKSPPTPEAYQATFPYLSDPLSGYDVPAA
jgi:hypothetical protein